MAATKKEIKAALGAYLRAKLDLNEDDRSTRDYVVPGRPEKLQSPDGQILHIYPPGAVIPEKEGLEITALTYQDHLTGAETIPQDEAIQSFLKASGMPDIKKDDPIYQFAGRELIKVKQAMNRIEQERSQGLYNSPTELSILSAYPEQPQGPVIEEKKETRLISEVVEQYISENVSDGNWKASTLKEYKAHLIQFTEMVGDCPLVDMTHETTRAFFDDLKKIPTNRKKAIAYRDKSIMELLEMEIPKEKLISGKTINNIMTSLSAFYNWCVVREYMPQDYTRKMRIKIEKRADELKDSFTESDLKQLFANLSPYNDNPGQIHRWWIPMIGLYTGARLEEISQLHVSDIRQERGVWVFDVNDLDNKELKNKSSRRLIPIHNSIMKSGFLEYHDKIKVEGHKRLFPHLKPMKGKCGHYISRWFSPYLEKLGIKTAAHNVSYHSFRHTFITGAKHIGLEESHVSQLVGHATTSITFGRYGKGYDVARLKEIIDQVVFSL
ncbi:site-specific integrase [Desulfobacula sp.]|uniref:site-specific integrase n=1 Tax=Desulfobacula sp. TaxID=2593537 RepID=UPI00261CC9E6|nr:site-specific integrase [Desulfobacula sp.]